MMATFVAATMLYGPYLWCRLRRETFESYGLRWDLSARALKETVLWTALTLTPLTFIALAWPGLSLPHSPSPQTAMTQITAGFVAAVVEETFFRGWVQSLLSRRLGAFPAIVIATGLLAFIQLIVTPEPNLMSTFFNGHLK